MVFEPHIPLDLWGYIFYLSFPVIFISVMTLNVIGLVIGGVGAVVGWNKFKPRINIKRKRRTIVLR